MSKNSLMIPSNHKRIFGLIAMVFLMAGMSPARATTLPNCAGSGTIDSNIEDGFTVNAGECAVVNVNIGTIVGDIIVNNGGTLYIDANIATIDGGITVNDGGTVYIYGDINNLNGSLVLLTGSILYLYGDIKYHDGRLRIRGGDMEMYGDITTDARVDLEDPGNLRMYGANLTLLDGSFLIEDFAAVLTMNHGSSVVIADPGNDFDNRGGASEVVSDGSGNNIVTATFEGSSGSLTCSGGSCTDTPGVTKGVTITETNNKTITFESGTVDKIGFVLNEEPSDDVIISFSSSNTAEATVSPTSITFTDQNWNTYKYIDVTGVDDAVEDGTQQLFIQTSISSGDATYNNMVVPDVVVLNRDDGANGSSSYSLPPLAGSTTLSTNEDIAKFITFADLGYSDPDGDPMEKIKIDSLPKKGVVFLDNINANGQYDVGEQLSLGDEVTKVQIDAGIFGHLPDQDLSGTSFDYFKFSVSDGTAFSNDSGTITFDVSAVNDPPSITVPDDQIVNEDDDIQGIAFFVDEGGGVDEDVQTLTVTVTSSDQSIVQDVNVVHDFSDNGTDSASDETPSIDITPELEAFGEVTITITVQDNGGGSNTTIETFILNVRPVNDQPTFTPGLDITEDEDFGTYNAAWASAISKGPSNESAQVLAFSVTNDNNALFEVQPEISSTGVLSFTTKANAFGQADVDVYLYDNGGVLYGGVDTSPIESFRITLNEINDIPTAGNEAVNVAISATHQFSAAEFSSQYLDVEGEPFDGIRIVERSGITSGSLTYNLASIPSDNFDISVGNISKLRYDAPGSAQIESFTFKVEDDNNDGYSDETYTMFLTVGTPSLPTASNINRVINEDVKYTFTTSEFEGVYTHPDNIPLGSIKVTSLETVGDLTLGGIPVTVNQTISMSQVDQLTFSPGFNENGNAYDSFDFTVLDAADNESASAYSYSFDVTALNDAPTFTLLRDEFAYDEEGAQTIAGFLTAQDDGDPELTQVLNIGVTNSDNSLFDVQPAINLSTGELTYTPADKAQGLATVTVTVADDGGTPNGGEDASSQTFKITIMDGISTTPTTIPAGSYIVDMGNPTGIEDGLKPYGLVYDLTSNYEVPVSIAINVNKAKDGIDFSHEAVDYKGAPFIISEEFITPEIAAVITSWEDNGSKVGGAGKEGIEGNYTTTDALNVPIYVTFTSYPTWTLDTENAAIAIGYFDLAGIPSSAYKTAYPYELDETDDIFVLPHADPTWADHSNLYYWNQSLDNGGQAGWIWAGCHAVSVIENLSNPNDPEEKMNFLSDPALLHYTDDGHAAGTAPYTYDYSGHQFMQFVGTYDGATDNGSEQIYLPKLNAEWRESSQVAVYDPDHPDIPTNSPGEAAKMVYGPAFGDPDNGMVLYQGGHSLEAGTDQEQAAAIRAFLNFSFLAPVAKVPVTSSFFVPEEMGQGISYSLLIDAAGRDGETPTYEWSSSCGGSFDDITSATPEFIPPAVGSPTACLISVKITDSFGRQTFETQNVNILATDAPTFSSLTSPVESTDEDIEVELTFAEILAASDATDSDGTVDAFVVLSVENGTLRIGADSGSASSYSETSNEQISAGLNAYWEPDSDENGTFDAFTLLAEDNVGAHSNDPVMLQVMVNAVNDVPGFTKGNDQSMDEDAGAQTVNSWATGISAGPANENSQTVSFNVSNDNNALFSVQPDVDASGNLTYTPAAEANGSTTVTISISDDGGTPNGGADTSADQTFVITISAVNDVPTISAISSQFTSENEAITGISFAVDEGGGSDEDTQMLTVTVTSSNQTLVPDANITVNYTDNGAASADALSPTIDITPASNQIGTTTITVTVQDDGGGTSTVVDTFDLNVDPVSVRGPGGVSDQLKYWFKADAGVTQTGPLVDSWEDQSASAVFATSSGTNRSSLLAANVSINNQPSLTFDGDDYLIFSHGASDNVDRSYGVVLSTATPSSERDAVIFESERISLGYRGSGESDPSRFYDRIGGVNNLGSTQFPTGQWLIHQKTVDIASGEVSFYFNGSIVPETSTHSPQGETSSTTYIGEVTGLNRGLNGELGEVYKYAKILNHAEKAVIANYLSAKYDLPLSASDFYTGDDSGNGNFDFDVIGVGTSTDEAVPGSHTLSIGFEGLSVEAVSGFEDDDYVFAGHSNVTNALNTGDLGGLSDIHSRWERIWYFDKTDAATALAVNLTFDFSDAGLTTAPTTAANYKLIYRSGQSGNWSVAATGTSASSDQLTFNNVTLADGDGYYTIGQTQSFILSTTTGNTDETGTTAQFNVVLGEQPESSVVLSVISDDTDEGTVDKSSLTFNNANWDDAQTVTITGVDDADIDGDITFDVIISVVDASSDDTFDALPDQAVSITNADDDVFSNSENLIINPSAEVDPTTYGWTWVSGGWGSGAEIAPQHGDFHFYAGSGAGTFEIYQDIDVSHLAIPIDAGEVDFSFSGYMGNYQGLDEARIIVEYRDASSNVLSSYNTGFQLIQAWTLYCDKTTALVNTRSIRVRLQSRRNAGVDNDGYIDNLVLQAVTQTPGFDICPSVVYAEEGGTTSFDFALSSPPSSNVTIDITSLDPGAATANVSSISFDNSNWDTPQAIIISGVQDADSDNENVEFTLIVNDAVSDNSFDGISQKVLAVIDDDEVGYTVSAISGNIQEAGTSATFSVVLNNQPTSDVVFDISSSDTNEGTVDQASLTFTNSNWSVPQTVSVTGVDDDEVDGDQAFNILVSVNDAASDNLFDPVADQNVIVTNEDDDVAGFTVVESGGSTYTTEDGTTDSFTIVLDAQPINPVVINIPDPDPTEISLDATSLTFNNANWNIPQTVIVTGLDDLIDDDGTTILITFSVDPSSDAGFVGVPDVSITAINEDNDPPGIVITPNSGLIVNESGTTATFNVNLLSVPTADVTLNLYSSDSGEGTVSPTSYVFNASNWNGTNTFTITGVDESLIDGDVNFTIITYPLISEDSHSGINPVDVSVINEDDDVADFTVSAISGNTHESGTTADFTVVLDAQPLSNVVFNVTAADSGEGTVDKSTLTFTSSDWNSPKTVTVMGKDEPLLDGDITYNIVVSVNDAASDDAFDALADKTVSVTNEDNEVAGFSTSVISGITNESGTTDTLLVVLDVQPLTDVVFSINSNDTGEGTLDLNTLTFTNSNWGASQEVIITGVDDGSLVDGDITYNVTVAVEDASSDDSFDALADQLVAITNEDDDVAGYTVSTISGNTNESGTTATFTVVLDAQPLSNVVFDVTSEDSSEGTVDLATLTFTNTDWSTDQTVTVAGVDESIIDGNITYDVTVSVKDASSNNAFDDLSDQTIAVTNEDDDAAGFTLSTTTVSTTEGSTTTFTVVLDAEPNSNVKIDISSADTGAASTDVTSVSFDNTGWDTPQTVTVSGEQDDDLNNESVTLTASLDAAASDDNFDTLPDQTVTATITDDDAAGYSVTESGGTSAVTESGTIDTFEVVLTSQPTSNVTIKVTADDASELSVDQTSLVFSNANWDTPQTVTITGQDDPEDDGDIISSITLSVEAGSDGNFTGLGDQVIHVTNVDDDAPGITITPVSGLTVSESGTSSTFTIALQSSPTSDVQIDFSSDNTAEGTVSPASVTLNSSNWDSPQTVTVTGVDDVTVDGDIDFNIITAEAVSTDPSYSGMDPVDVAVTNTDDDAAGFTLSTTTVSMTEGSTATFTIVLNAAPQSTVTLDISSDDTGAASTDVTSVSFDNTNWDTPQIITVSGGETTLQYDITATITTSVNTTSDDAFTGLADQDVIVTIESVNDKPVITAQATLTTDEETDLTIALADLTVTDPDNTYPADFTLTVNTGTNYTVSGTTITPATDFNGTLTVPVTVNDGTVDSDPFNLTVTVDAINDKPTFTKGNDITIDEDAGVQSVSGWATSISGGSANENGQTLTFVISVDNASLFAVEPVVGSSGDLTFTPADNAFGESNVSVFLKDDGGTANGGEDQSDTEVFKISINGINDKPQIQDHTNRTVTAGVTFEIQLSDLVVSDPDNTYPDDFTLHIEPSDKYTTSGNAVTIIEPYSGLIDIMIAVNDGDLDSDLYAYSVDVESGANSPPVITGQQTVSMPEDGSYEVQLSDLIYEDKDNSDADLTLHLESGENYTFVDQTVTPSADFNGALAVSVKLFDGSDFSEAFDVSIIVTAVNDAPVASPDMYEVLLGNSLSVNVLENDTDIDSENLLASVMTKSTAQFELEIESNGTLTFVSINQIGTLTEFYTVCDDGTPQQCVEGMISIEIIGGDFDDDGLSDEFELENGDSDLDGILDYQDTDSDNDGIPDKTEVGVDSDNPVDSDGDGTPDYLDDDSDADGLSDLIEGAEDCDSDGIPNYLDTRDLCNQIVADGGFSPNGDGVNDHWVLDGIEAFPENHVTIFNRWGSIVLEIKNYDNINNVWFGDNKNGKEVPDGTYFYVVTLKNTSGDKEIPKNINGFITISR
ncbi:MAG: gliding motility-associated C-terminal domain-containing protein [Cyclobacteriaceae bacterium]